MRRRDLFTATTVAMAAAGETRLPALPPWSPGVLEIHHISTGRGNSAFLICPDATTMLIDAGSYAVPADRAFYVVAPRPDDSRRPGEWIARYIRRRLQPIRPVAIDLFAATHLHEDHVSGIRDVAAGMSIKRILDRHYPDYDYPAPLNDATQREYRAFLRSWLAAGGSAERVRPGSDRQIVLTRDPGRYPDFTVRNIAANGEVWTGTGNATQRFFPPLSALRQEDYPSENMCSIALRFNYGKFSYFTGGDMVNCTNYGRDLWRDIETPVARVTGAVDVAVANHHGYIDATGPEFVRALRPRVFIVQAWNAAHPSMPALYNMLSQDIYPGPRDIFSTAVKPESRVAVRRLAELKSLPGHIVIRVEQGGDRYGIWVLSSEDETGRVIAYAGPYGTQMR